MVHKLVIAALPQAGVPRNDRIDWARNQLMQQSSLLDESSHFMTQTAIRIATLVERIHGLTLWTSNKNPIDEALLIPVTALIDGNVVTDSIDWMVKTDDGEFVVKIIVERAPAGANLQQLARQYGYYDQCLQWQRAVRAVAPNTPTPLLLFLDVDEQATFLNISGE